MKKSFVFALAGVAMLALTQCGPSGSKEYKMGCKLFDEMETSIKKAKSCDEIDAAAMDFLGKAMQMSSELKDESDKATEEENAKLKERMDALDKMMNERRAELCGGAE